MCLAVPMKISSLMNNMMGVVNLDGAEFEADLSLVEAPKIGDYVIVHAGYAIEKLDEKEADERLVLFRQLADAEDKSSRPGWDNEGKESSTTP